MQRPIGRTPSHAWSPAERANRVSRSGAAPRGCGLSRLPDARGGRHEWAFGLSLTLLGYRPSAPQHPELAVSRRSGLEP
jgi:hypothetical protein